MHASTLLLALCLTLGTSVAQKATATLREMPSDCRATGQPAFVVKDDLQLPVLGGRYFAPTLSGDSVDEKALGHTFETVWGLFWFAPGKDGKAVPLDLRSPGQRICGRIAVLPEIVATARLPLALWQVIGPKHISLALRLPNSPSLLGLRFYGQGALLYQGPRQWTMLLSQNFVNYRVGT